MIIVVLARDNTLLAAMLKVTSVMNAESGLGAAGSKANISTLIKLATA